MSGEPNDLLRELGAARQRYESLGWPKPDLLLVSGSGLAVDLGRPTHGPLPLADLLPFPVHRVAGHPHQVELLEPRPGKRVLYCRGRLHTYQGYDPHQAVLPVRLAAQLGARTLLQTNAAGSLRPHLPPGRLVAVRDHLNLMGMNPLRGELPEDWGPRFPIMTGAYDADLRGLAAERAAALGVELDEGIYAGIAGPTYETPAEAEMLRNLGADLTGMSTVLEVIAARHMGLRCLVLSLVTNFVAAAAADHDEVLETGKNAAGDVARLLAALLAEPGLY